MRLEFVRRRPPIPWWAIAIVGVHLALVATYAWVSHRRAEEAPPLCLFRRVTGLPCLACGSTRMVLSLGRGDLLTAAGVNPLAFVAGAAALGVLVLRVGFRRRVVWNTSAASRRALTIGVVTLVLANWVYLLAAR